VSAGLPVGITVFERGWLSSNNILLAGTDTDAVLIDSGYVTHATQTVALVEEALGGRPLNLLLNTHLHSDHCGGNAALQFRYQGVRTEVPEGEFAAVASWREEALTYRATGQHCPRFRVDGALVADTERRLGGLLWQIHAAPGHDPQSVILFEPISGTLISADALWENGFGVVFPELVGEPSFDDVAATLDMIESLAPRRIIPGHGRIFDEVAAALDTARKRLARLAIDPQKHARHAFKVLIKFKLLEQQTMSIDLWAAWRDATPYLETIRSRFFDDRNLQSLSDEILDELIIVGAARRERHCISNSDRL